jgi:TonB family protein
MTKETSHLVAVGLILVGGLSVLGAAPANAKCHPPHFREVDFYGLISVSLRRRDFTPEKLACVAQTLRRSHPHLRSPGVAFFTSYEAAEHFHGMPIEGVGGGPRWDVWAREFRGIYSFDDAKRTESLAIAPAGFGTSLSLRTTLDLPVAAPVQCRWAIENRCVMVVGEVTYPAAARKGRASGTVVIAGTVRRDGSVGSLRVVKAEVTPDGGRKLLENAALQNLAAWQLDSAGREDPIRITYRFGLDPSMPGGAAERWDSPDHVTVLGN